MSLIARLRSELFDLFGGADDLMVARAAHLHANILIALFGSLGTSIAITLFMWRDVPAMPLIVWVTSSCLPALIRTWLWRHDAFGDFEDAIHADKAREYLGYSTLAALLVGLNFSAGWAFLVPYASVNNQLIYLMAVIALLFGGLHTYSPNFTTYLAFSATSIWPVPLISFFGLPLKIDNLNFFILLISLLSTMFAMRFGLSFLHNHQLRKNVEHLLEEVTRKHQQALAANAEKSKFLAAVSHDLRQPMHAISLNVATISSLIEKKSGDVQLAEFLKEQTGRLTGNVSYLNEMFDALLNMSRLEAGIASIELRSIDLRPVIERIGRDFQQISKDLNLAFSIKCSMPDEVFVAADASALERILRNLVSNALKNTVSGGIRLRVLAKHDHVYIRVIDTGSGIRREWRDKIFQEFVQVQHDHVVPVARNQFGHSFGLGLAIARRLAERMQTQIRCHSWVGKGSVFSFALPLSRPLHPVQQEHDYEVIESIAPDALIVIIDDDLQILDSTAALLRIHGVKVVSAVGSAEAIEQLRHIDKKPDLLLTDFRLQGETGIDAINIIREEFNDEIPALIITGETSADDIQGISLFGFHMLFKPLSSEALIQAIAKALHAHVPSADT